MKKFGWLLVAVTVAGAFASATDADAQGEGSSGYKSYKGGKAIDGDTFRYQGNRYRIQQYNAPELGQPWSRRATRDLQRKLDSGSYEWKSVTQDAYGRTIVNEREK